MSAEKQRIIDEAVEWLGTGNEGYWITVNGLTKSLNRFEQDLIKLSVWLNDYCYGRSYKSNGNQLKMVAGVEKGSSTGVLHAHIAMTYSIDISRSFYDINAFVRKRWYKLCGASGSVFGNLVDVQEIGDHKSRVKYALKDIQPNNHTKFHVLYL